MLDLTKNDVDKIVDSIEYLVRYQDKRTVARMMKDCDLTFDEYRIVCDLAMPTIREHSDTLSAKHSLAYWKAQLQNQVDRLTKRCDRLLGLR